jgi:uncharacterized protein DUF6491
MKRTLQALVTALLLAGCAAQRPAGALLNDYLPYAGPPINSFHFWHLYSWEAVGPYHVVLWVDPWTAYFVTVWQPCINLEWATRIGVTSTANTVSHFEAVLVPHHERCPIQEIRQIDAKRLKEARAAAAAAKKGVAAPAPAPAAQQAIAS